MKSLATIFGSSVILLASSFGSMAQAPEIPQVEVRFAHLPYFDHSQAIIGLKQGWFKEAGITFLPDDVGIVVNTEDASGVFASGRVDVLSGGAGLFIPGVKTLPPIKQFFYGDIFQGFAIMAQPDGNYKSFEEFVAEGMSADDAYKATMEQMKGKRFAFPSEALIKGFIDLSLEKGGLTLEDVEAVGAPGDPANVALMQAGRSDFQVGGVPSRLTLEQAGFKPILTSGDLAANAQPTADSVELRAVFHDGWFASDEWLETNYDTALRIASVGFRINQFINDHPDEAAAIHTPFLNSIAGTSFEDSAAKIAYSGLDPFWTFEQQEGWILDKSNPLNGEYVIGAAIKVFEEGGLVPVGEVKWDQFTIVPRIYNDLLDYKAKTDELFVKFEASPPTGESAALLEQAKAFYAAFNFLDAYRFASAANGG